MIDLNPQSILHSRLTLHYVSLLQGKAYTPDAAHLRPAYLNGVNGLMVKPKR